MIGMTVCSGIGVPELSAPWIDWRYQSEVAPFPKSVLAHHFPDAVNLGDMTKFQEWPNADIDVLCGGTPCQSFSVAGLRKGLADPRGNLALTYLAIADRYRPRWLVWENVPGVLSAVSHKAPDTCPPGRDLDGDDGPEDGTEILVEDDYNAVEDHALWCFMAGAGELGYHGGFITLDAQYVRVPSLPRAVPQRRKRVFFVGYPGDWRPAGAVLLDPESMQEKPAPRQEAGQTVAGTLSARAGGGGGLGTDFELDGGLIPICAPDVAYSLRGEGFDASDDGTGRQNLIVVYDPTQITSPGNYSNPQPGDPCHPLTAAGHSPIVVFDCKGTQVQVATNGVAPTLRSMGHANSHQNAGGQLAVTDGYTVRRLTPLECERLMGLPDGYTDVIHNGKPAFDGPRYKALGNAWAKNCGEYLFDRIRFVEDLIQEGVA
ncbi:MAG: DNA cytosine methyltransferase [Pseudomonadota bacterium]